jgi:hypothetical protein
LIHHEDFDQPWGGPTNQVINPSIWVESWSGYALNRQQGATFAPWVVPMTGTNLAYQVDPKRGAVRFFYMPSWSSASTGQGNGPGSMARLLTLVSTNGAASAVWWSLVTSGDGNAVYLVCQTETGPAACLTAPVSFQTGSWHCLAVGYTDTNSALFLDGQQVAVGGGLAGVPAELVPFTSLVVGSSLSGGDAAAGQIEELSAFTGKKRFHQMLGQSFGLSPEWEIADYYSKYAAVAALGPISEAEEEAQRESRKAARAARLAAQEAAAMAAPALLSSQDGPLGRGPQLDSYDASQGFSLLTPQILQATNVFLTLTNNDPSIGYDIYFAPTLSAPVDWNIIATGVVGQATFTVPMTVWQGYYRGAIGGDWDGDGVPNWMDADPLNPNIGALQVIIYSPANGSTINN